MVGPAFCCRIAANQCGFPANSASDVLSADSRVQTRARNITLARDGRNHASFKSLSDFSTSLTTPSHSNSTTQFHIMEVLLGITGKDFTIIAASKAAMRGATILKASDDKTRALNKHTLMAFSGEAGDTVQFAEYIQRNAQLYSMRNETDLSPSGLAHFVRDQLASSLRSRRPYNVNLLMGGVDPITGKPHLYWLDYLAALADVPYAAHGYAQYYCLSILDKHHHPDITLGQGIKLLTLCVDELKRRLPIDFKGMVVKAIKADGIIDIEFDDDRIVKSA
ncbi:putative proteasome subunit beta type-4 [Claviceps purpurea]|nr:putative proteasome subunit beta type-4 [Claviceps purpurea]KAG6233972.1 putative proteasome subunit beta type-4 [Claviceps purpurea]KAG6241118.1 putative proteasome subunit beta type-4 [Claviceps purpurea]KAG6254123.1 putative proteasome subunit beta type-4 [Claviceps purpurea]